MIVKCKSKQDEGKKPNEYYEDEGVNDWIINFF